MAEFENNLNKKFNASSLGSVLPHAPEMHDEPPTDQRLPVEDVPRGPRRSGVVLFQRVDPGFFRFAETSAAQESIAFSNRLHDQVTSRGVPEASTTFLPPSQNNRRTR